MKTEKKYKNNHNNNKNKFIRKYPWCSWCIQYWISINTYYLSLTPLLNPYILTHTDTHVPRTFTIFARTCCCLPSSRCRLCLSVCVCILLCVVLLMYEIIIPAGNFASSACRRHSFCRKLFPMSYRICMHCVEHQNPKWYNRVVCSI